MVGAETSSLALRKLLRLHKVANKKLLTHQALDQTEGGKFQFSDVDKEVLYDRLSLEIVKRRKKEKGIEIEEEVPQFYVAERVSEYFHMYIDIDLHLETKLDDSKYKKIVHDFYNLLKMFYPSYEEDDKIFDIVSTRPLCENAQGIHLHCPNLTVILKEAMTLQLAFKKHFEKAGQTEIMKGIDYNVYRNGLRMLGSSKCKACSTCNSNKRSGGVCKDCDNSKKVHIPGKEYDIFYVLTKGGVADRQEKQRLKVFVCMPKARPFQMVLIHLDDPIHYLD